MKKQSQTVGALRRQITREIANHAKWCGPKCQTFLPESYRNARLRGSTAKGLQGNYDGCHIFR